MQYLGVLVIIVVGCTLSALARPRCHNPRHYSAPDRPSHLESTSPNSAPPATWIRSRNFWHQHHSIALESITQITPLSHPSRSGGVPVPPLTQPFWNYPPVPPPRSRRERWRLRSLLAAPLTCGSSSRAGRLRNQMSRRCLPPLVRSAVGSPCPIDRRFAPIFLRGSPRALSGQPWVRRVVGPVSRVGGDRLGRPFCERGRRRGGVRPRGCAQVVGHRRSIATLTGPRHLGLPAPVTS